MIRASGFGLAAMLVSAPVLAVAQVQGGILTQSGLRATVVLSAPSARSLEDERENLAQLAAQCDKIIDLRPVDSVAFVRRALPALAVSDVRAGDVVELLVLPRADEALFCSDYPQRSGIVEVRASLVTFDTLIAPSSRIDSVVALRDGRPIVLRAPERIPLRGLGLDGFRSLGADALRFAVAMQDVLPTATQPAPKLAIEVWSLGGLEVIELTWTVLRDLVDVAMVMRVNDLSDRPPSIELPVPEDAQLRFAQAAYRRGGTAGAVRLANTRLRAGTLETPDVVWARALATLAFDAAGDDLAAGINAEYLVQAAPCFTFDPSAPETVHRRLSSVSRPMARCQALENRQVAQRALLMPGFGRPSTDRYDVARSAFVSVALGWAILESQRLRREARNQYEFYLAAQAPQDGSGVILPTPRERFARAQQTRADGIAFATSAVAVYAGQALYSMWREARFRKHLKVQLEYGSALAEPSRVGLHQPSRPGVAGIGVEWRW